MENKEKESNTDKIEVVKNRKPKITIVGSFSFKSQIDEIITYLEAQDIEIMAPRKGSVIQKINGFKLIDGDTVHRETDTKELERRFIEAMINSDAVYLVNPDGYNGLLSASEMGYASSLGIPIFAMEPLDWEEPEHPMFQTMLQLVFIVSVQELPDKAREAMKQNTRPQFRVDSKMHPHKVPF